jgi:DNA-binding GntR family transcriptional regulator
MRMTSSETQPNGRQQLDVAYDAIRSAILRCELGPGDHVSELQLSSRFGFGRASVRSALTRLGHERLVEANPRRGYRIAPVTFEHVRDLYGTRLVVEPGTAALAAARADASLIAELERWNRACAMPPGDADLVAVREANKGFHAALGRASGNQRLASLSASLMDELDRVLYLPRLAPLWERLDATFVEHLRIIDAVRDRDAEAAQEAAYEHVLANRSDAIEALIASPSVGAIDLRSAE